MAARDSENITITKEEYNGLISDRKKLISLSEQIKTLATLLPGFSKGQEKPKRLSQAALKKHFDNRSKVNGKSFLG
ncbi:hypothetical protein [Flavobacterium rhizosphaerae]|uniref:Uncharacterized protein n=1 Tax=Flavobacterium rhizosphaerae TaxID=3163298 RepID=A0ABW8Z0H5_9FLAO